MKTHVFGMAKSSLNLNGAKRQKLELDYLRLVYACQRFPGSRAYLVVTDDVMLRSAKAWAAKYEAEGAVCVRLLPTDKLTAEFKAEKVRNLLGMTEALAGEGAKADAVAAIGEAVCEEFLLELINGFYNGFVAEISHSIRQKILRQQLPLQINWDFYARYDGPLPALPPSDALAG